MFDWPEASHTSPVTTSLKVIAFLPRTTTSNGSRRSSGGRSARKRPLGSAVASTVCPAAVTVIFSPGSAMPHTGTLRPSWSTMWSPKMAGRRTSASNDASRTMVVMAAEDTMIEHVQRRGAVLLALAVGAGCAPREEVVANDPAVHSLMTLFEDRRPESPAEDDTHSVEVGVKFKSAVRGEVVAI